MRQPKLIVLILLFFVLVFCRCKQTMVASKRENAIQEITKAEDDFAKLCAKEGLQKGFAAYADDSANIRSNDSLISGKQAIEDYYGQPFFKNVSLQWKPDFTDASESGEMGYTFGHYTFKLTNNNSKKKESKGIFHTVWKKKNGVWRFVWDS